MFPSTIEAASTAEILSLPLSRRAFEGFVWFEASSATGNKVKIKFS